MKAHVCDICEYVYDEKDTGVPFDKLPEDWWCPNCGSDKEYFELKEIGKDL
jgi:rubredoxin